MLPPPLFRSFSSAESCSQLLAECSSYCQPFRFLSVNVPNALRTFVVSVLFPCTVQFWFCWLCWRNLYACQQTHPSFCCISNFVSHPRDEKVLSIGLPCCCHSEFATLEIVNPQTTQFGTYCMHINQWSCCGVRIG